MKYLFFLGHPAHFHMFRYSIERLKKNGHTVFVIIKTKDILEDLVKGVGWEYYNIFPKERADGKLGILTSLMKKNWALAKFAFKHRPNIMLASAAETAHVGSLLRIPAIYLGEDDARLTVDFARMTYPFTDVLISPTGCDMGKWNKKTVHYNGYQKLAYLHPKQFVPSQQVVEKYISLDKPYFLLRFAKLKAHHDQAAVGISSELTKRVVQILEQKGNVYISAERELEPELEKHRLHINPLDIHHFMAFAQIYMGDSQSMAMEAAMLGTPSIRFNTWVGNDNVAVFKELEFKYDLTYGIHSSQGDQMIKKLEELLVMPNMKQVFHKRRDTMLKDKIDVTSFLVWFIEEYPQSLKAMRANSDYQLRFK